MKRFYLLLLISTFGFSQKYNFVTKGPLPKEEKPIVIIVPSYNNKKFYKRNLESILSQKYTNFRVIYTNDASSDGTGDFIQEYVKKSALGDRFKYVENKENKGPLYNIYHMIHSCKDNEIIVTVDGDDHLLHDKVLQSVNRAYADDRVWMTYGSSRNKYHHKGCSRPMRVSMLQEGRHRELIWRWSHLRTCYAGLFKSVSEEKWKRAGRFYQSAGDVAIMLYLMDLSREHVFYNPEATYYYNMDNPLSEFKIDLQGQTMDRDYIWSQPPLERLYFKEEFIKDVL